VTLEKNELTIVAYVTLFIHSS